MNELLASFQPQILLLLLALTRISGLVMTAPLLGSRSVPVRVRGMLALALTALVAPLLAAQASFTPPDNLVHLTLLVAKELLLGITLGLCSVILFSGLHLAGQMLGQMSGLQLADLVDPTFDGSVPVYGQLLDLLMMAIFVGLGGHREVMAALLDSFRVLPLGETSLPEGLVPLALDVLTHSFVLGVRVAAPTLLALLLAIILLGLVGRTMPAFNLQAVGYGLNASVLTLMLAASLGSIAWVFQHHHEQVLVLLVEWMHQAAPR